MTAWTSSSSGGIAQKAARWTDLLSWPTRQSRSGRCQAPSRGQPAGCSGWREGHPPPGQLAPRSRSDDDGGRGAVEETIDAGFFVFQKGILHRLVIVCGNKCRAPTVRRASGDAGATPFPPFGSAVLKNRPTLSPNARTSKGPGRTVKVHRWLLVPDGAVTPTRTRSSRISRRHRLGRIVVDTSGGTPSGGRGRPVSKPAKGKPRQVRRKRPETVNANDRQCRHPDRLRSDRPPRSGRIRGKRRRSPRPCPSFKREGPRRADTHARSASNTLFLINHRRNAAIHNSPCPLKVFDFTRTDPGSINAQHQAEPLLLPALSRTP